MLILIMLAVGVLGAVYLELQRGPNPKIPPASSPNGKITRMVGGALAAIAGGLFIFDAIRGGLTRTNILLTFNAILFAVLTLIAAKYRQSNK